MEITKPNNTKIKRLREEKMASSPQSLRPAAETKYMNVTPPPPPNRPTMSIGLRKGLVKQCYSYRSTRLTRLLQRRASEAIDVPMYRSVVCRPSLRTHPRSWSRGQAGAHQRLVATIPWAKIFDEVEVYLPYRMRAARTHHADKLTADRE